MYVVQASLETGKGSSRDLLSGGPEKWQPGDIPLSDPGPLGQTKPVTYSCMEYNVMCDGLDNSKFNKT